MIPAQSLADSTKQEIARGMGQIIGTHGRGIPAAAGSSYSDYRLAGFETMGDDRGFDARAVYGLDHAIEGPLEQTFHVTRSDEFRHAGDAAVGVNEPHPLGQDADFWPSHGAIQSGELTVDVRDADIVKVDESDRPDA